MDTSVPLNFFRPDNKHTNLCTYLFANYLVSSRYADNDNPDEMFRALIDYATTISLVLFRDTKLWMEFFGDITEIGTSLLVLYEHWSRDYHVSYHSY